MTRFQIARVAGISWIVAAIQVAGIDRFLLFGVAHLVLPLFLAVTVGSRLPLTNAVVGGALIGGTWDLLAIDLFGRYALGLAIAGGVASLALFGRTADSRRMRLVRRFVVTVVAVVGLVSVSAIAGETLPPFSSETLAGVALTSAFGALVTGTVLRRIVLPGRTVWDPAPVRSTGWVDHRAGLYSVPVQTSEREAA